MKKQGLIICAAACAVGLAAGIAVGSIALKNGSAVPESTGEETKRGEITFTVPEIPVYSSFGTEKFRRGRGRGGAEERHRRRSGFLRVFTLS